MLFAFIGIPGGSGQLQHFLPTGWLPTKALRTTVSLAETSAFVGSWSGIVWGEETLEFAQLDLPIFSAP